MTMWVLSPTVREREGERKGAGEREGEKEKPNTMESIHLLFVNPSTLNSRVFHRHHLKNAACTKLCLDGSCQLGELN